jgi:hypothetical protein
MDSALIEAAWLTCQLQFCFGCCYSRVCYGAPLARGIHVIVPRDPEEPQVAYDGGQEQRDLTQSIAPIHQLKGHAGVYLEVVEPGGGSVRRNTIKQMLVLPATPFDVSARPRAMMANPCPIRVHADQTPPSHPHQPQSIPYPHHRPAFPSDRHPSSINTPTARGRWMTTNGWRRCEARVYDEPQPTTPQNSTTPTQIRSAERPNHPTPAHTRLPHAYSISCSVFPSKNERGSFMGVVESGDREAGGRVRSGCSRREHGAERKRGKGREGGVCDNPGRANGPFAQSLIQVRTSCEDTSQQAVKTRPACS